MRSTRTVRTGPDLSVHAVTCADDHAGWSEPEDSDTVGIVLARRGRFRLRGRGGEVTVDRTVGYVELPGRERSFSHPEGGDECTALVVGRELWEDAVDGRSVPVAFGVDGRVDTAHRMLLRAADDLAAAERLLCLLHRAFRDTPLPVTASGPGRRALAESAREAILADHPDARDLVRLARLLGVGPAHLSRTFRHHTGVTVSRFRTRVRVARALDRIEEGTGGLAGIAADLGFADQAHLTRAVRAETGGTPAALRAALAGGAPGSGVRRAVPGTRATGSGHGGATDRSRPR